MKAKKLICMLLLLAIIAAAAGCGSKGGSSGRAANNKKGVADVLQEGMAEADGRAESSAAQPDAQPDDPRQSGLNDNAPKPAVEPDGKTALSSTEGIDVDLASMSGTMVYSEVYNMMCEPDNYIGKTIRMNGIFSTYHNESTGKYYFTCVIQDATACCAQGMEFVLTDDYAYPDDYPKNGELITVVGVFDTYMEDDFKYCTLRNAKLES